MRDSLACYLIPYGLFMNSPYVSMPLIMIDLSQLMPLCSFLHSRILLTNFPSVAAWRPLLPLTSRAARDGLDRAMSRVVGGEEWMSRTPAEKQYILQQITEMGAASLELSLLLPALFNLRSGLRGLVTLVLLLQYLMFRVGSNSYLAVSVGEWHDGERTVQQFDVSVNQLVYRPGCPQFIRWNGR